jgi:hypothetical protein
LHRTHNTTTHERKKESFCWRLLCCWREALIVRLYSIFIYAWDVIANLSRIPTHSLIFQIKTHSCEWLYIFYIDASEIEGTEIPAGKRRRRTLNMSGTLGPTEVTDED